MLKSDERVRTETHPALFSAAGEVADLMRGTDWSATSLGPPETWPHSLRTVIRILLTSRYAMWMGWGPDLRFFYNDAYAAMTLGAKHPWALGRPAREVWAEIWPQIGPRIDKVLETGEATWDERLLLFLERSGYSEETYHTFSYSPVPDDQGRICGLFCVVTEETERVIDERRLGVLKELGSNLAASKSADEVFRASERALATDPRDLPFTVVYLFGPDRQARLVSMTGLNDAPASIAPAIALDDLAAAWGLGVHHDWNRLEVVPAPPWADWPTQCWDKRASDVVVAPIGQQGQSWPAGVFIAGANPYLRVNEKYRSFVNLFVGQVTAGFANARAHEEERRRAEALAAVDRAKTAFFSNVSHEFRTPLTLMLGPTEEALSSPRGALHGEDLRSVHRNQVRLLRLVNTLLDFSRIEAGRTQAAFEPVDLAEMTRDLAGVFRSAVERAGLRLIVECAQLSEPVYVDRQMWEKIVLNLLSNAFKFTFEGEISVKLRAQVGRAILTVTDTGVGIAEVEQPRVFDRFHRIEGTRARTHEGSGIGLALVHDLVQLHGGDIAVRSEPGRGSTFTVAIPTGTAHLPPDRLGVAVAAPSQPAAAAAYVAEAERWLPDPAISQDHVAGAPDAGLAASPGPSGARVLIADDNADMREYLTRLLGTRWTVEAVGDGAAALAAIRQRRPTLVITDVMMPGLDGFGFLRALRQDPETRTIPVIMLSARAGEDSRIDGLEAGADDYLVKPFSARELMARVATHLNLQRLEERLDQQRAALTELFRQSPLPVAVVRGPDLVFEIANAAYVDVIGNRSILGKPLFDALPELRGQGFAELLLQVMRTGVANVGRDAKVMMERHGRLQETYWTFIYSPLMGASGDNDGVVAICSEVTEQVLARQRLEALAAEAEAANRAKDEFLAMLGHELRNPLAPISTALQLMQLKGTPGVEHERTIIERQTRHLVRLVDDLLDVSRITQGKITLRKERLEIALIVARAVELASPLFEARGQGLELDVPPTGLLVEADPARLSQAIANLLMNAAKYTERTGHVTVRASRDGADVRVEVLDDGIGIQPEMLPRIFDLFVQERQALDRSQGGLGLGLAIVRSIMLLHGGSATAASEGAGRGSQFVVRLPAGTGAPTSVQPAEPGTGVQPTQAAGLAVLVVDDNKDAATLLATSLAMKGHRVRVALDGPAALSAASEFQPAVAVLDIGLPGMDGYELAAQLRRDARLPGLRLVAVTGYGQATDRHRTASAGFDAHLVKPVDIDNLDRMLRVYGKTPDR